MIKDKVAKQFTLTDSEQTRMELITLRKQVSPYWKAVLTDAIALIRQQEAEIVALKDILSKAAIGQESNDE